MNGSHNVTTRALTHRYGRTEVLKDVDLEVGTGVFGLLGPNGAGKTTLLRALATSLKASSGSLSILGLDPSDRGQRRNIRRRIGYLPQSLGYYPGFTVFEFVEYFALLKEIPAGESGRAAARAIERVGLSEKARTKMRKLSGGMLRRAGIAQAIVNDPELLLLDEPTAGLDPEQRVGFRELLREVGEAGTVVVSTHLVEDVGTACTDVALLEGGSLVFRGTPADLEGAADDSVAGDSPLERGYTAALARARS